jgi:hypothetical protein
MSFHAWKVLSKALYPAERASMLRYRQAIKNPKGALQVYLDPLTSNTFDFIASLTITVEFSAAGLLKLAEMKNLGVLHMVGPRVMRRSYHAIPHEQISEVRDTLVRAWSRAAMENGAFPVLRVLRLWNYEDVTDSSLRYISCFPALALFDICGCGFVDDRLAADISSKLGWRMCSEDPLGDLDGLCYEKSLNSRRHPAQMVRRRESEPFWDGLKVHRMQRDKVHDFLSRHPITVCGDPQKLPDDTEYVSQEDNKWALLDWKLFRNKGDIRGHEFINYMTWTRIGELLDDRDLTQAGVAGIDEQAFVDSKLITPIPMASVLLGRTEPVEARPLTSHVGLCGDDNDNCIDPNPSKQGAKHIDLMVFFRESKIKPRGVWASVIADVYIEGRSEKDEHKAKTAYDEKSRIRQSKRQRIEDMINSILSTTGEQITM